VCSSDLRPTGSRRESKGGETFMMYDVLALAELGEQMETRGFLGAISGNSNHSEACGSGVSDHC